MLWAIVIIAVVLLTGEVYYHCVMLRTLSSWIRKNVVFFSNKDGGTPGTRCEASVLMEAGAAAGVILADARELSVVWLG